MHGLLSVLGSGLRGIYLGIGMLGTFKGYREQGICNQGLRLKDVCSGITVL